MSTEHNNNLPIGPVIIRTRGLWGWIVAGLLAILLATVILAFVRHVESSKHMINPMLVVAVCRI